VGFVVGAGVAVVSAIFMAHSRFLEKSLLPLAVGVKATPIIAIAPLFVIWFGFGYTPKILIVALVVYFPVLVNAITGFRAISPIQKEFMQSIHASNWEVFLKLRLPYSLPYLFSAFKVSITLSVIGAVIGEWSGAEAGLGRMVLLTSINFQTVKLFASILYLALMGILLTIAVGLLERRLLFWHESVLVE
jgi:NitT/TauT family transport system permease protein